MAIAGPPQPGAAPEKAGAKSPWARAMQTRPTAPGERFQGFAGYKVMHIWQRMGSGLVLCVVAAVC